MLRLLKRKIMSMKNSSVGRIRKPSEGFFEIDTSKVSQLGTTRAGKTRLLDNLIPNDLVRAVALNDINAIKLLLTDDDNEHVNNESIQIALSSAIFGERVDIIKILEAFIQGKEAAHSDERVDEVSRVFGRK